MIRVVITHPDGRLGARTVMAKGYIVHAIDCILQGFGGQPPRSYRVKLLEVEPDELPPETTVERDANRLARRLVANIGLRLIQRGFEE